MSDVLDYTNYFGIVNTMNPLHDLIHLNQCLEELGVSRKTFLSTMIGEKSPFPHIADNLMECINYREFIYRHPLKAQTITDYYAERAGLPNIVFKSVGVSEFWVNGDVLRYCYYYLNISDQIRMIRVCRAIYIQCTKYPITRSISARSLFVPSISARPVNEICALGRYNSLIINTDSLKGIPPSWTNNNVLFNRFYNVNHLTLRLGSEGSVTKLCDFILYCCSNDGQNEVKSLNIFYPRRETTPRESTLLRNKKFPKLESIALCGNRAQKSGVYVLIPPVVRSYDSRIPFKQRLNNLKISSTNIQCMVMDFVECLVIGNIRPLKSPIDELSSDSDELSSESNDNDLVQVKDYFFSLSRLLMIFFTDFEAQNVFDFNDLKKFPLHVVRILINLIRVDHAGDPYQNLLDCLSQIDRIANHRVVKLNRLYLNCKSEWPNDNEMEEIMKWIIKPANNVHIRIELQHTTLMKRVASNVILRDYLSKCTLPHIIVETEDYEPNMLSTFFIIIILSATCVKIIKNAQLINPADFDAFLCDEF